MSNEIAQRNPQQALAAQIHEDERVRAQIVAVLPENVGFDRFARVAGIALLENPDLVEADRTSFFTALVKCAAASLVPDNRQAALVVYKDSKTGKKTVSFQPMIHGLVDAVAAYGWDLVTGVVHANDEFDYDDSPPSPWVKHRKPKLGSERGERIGAWAFATKRDAMPRLVVLDADDVAKCKAKARTDKFWRDWPEAMWAKTAGKKLATNLPLGERETQRIRRLLDETGQLEPAAAETALYGPTDSAAPAPALPSGGSGADSESSEGRGNREHLSSAKAAAPPVPEGTPEEAPADDSPQTPDQQADGTVGTDRGEKDPQAGGAPLDAGDAPGSGPEQTDLWAADAPPAEEGPSEEEIEAAAKTPIPAGDYEGRLIENVARTKAGREFLLKILKTVDEQDATRRAIAVFCEARLPEVWKQYAASRSGGAWAA